jgi:hypothetical protein
LTLTYVYSCPKPGSGFPIPYVLSCSWLYYHNNVLIVFTDCYMSKLIIKDNLTQYCSNSHTNCKYASLWYCCSTRYNYSFRDLRVLNNFMFSLCFPRHSSSVILTFKSVLRYWSRFKKSLKIEKQEPY